MTDLLNAFEKVASTYSIVIAMVIVGLVVWFSNIISAKLTRHRIHGSAIAIIIGLIMAFVGGQLAQGEKGLADHAWFSGLAVVGGAMFRDLAIVATAFGVHPQELRKGGLIGAVSLALGLAISFGTGCIVAYLAGYRDPESITTMGAGAATYIVGPVTGSALGASSQVIALSVAAGLVKAILVMTVTPLVAPFIGLNRPRSAMIFGGLMGTTSGVMAGLAATDPKLVPYGAMVATFYTGLGCLLGPSVVYFLVRALV